MNEDEPGDFFVARLDLSMIANTLYEDH